MFTRKRMPLDSTSLTARISKEFKRRPFEYTLNNVPSQAAKNMARFLISARASEADLTTREERAFVSRMISGIYFRIGSMESLKKEIERATPEKLVELRGKLGKLSGLVLPSKLLPLTENFCKQPNASEMQHMLKFGSEEATNQIGYAIAKINERLIETGHEDKVYGK